MIPSGDVLPMALVCKPRVCGDDPGSNHALEVFRQVNPACAGMIPTMSLSNIIAISKPRVCGDDPGAGALVFWAVT